MKKTVSMITALAFLSMGAAFAEEKKPATPAATGTPSAPKGDAKETKKPDQSGTGKSEHPKGEHPKGEHPKSEEKPKSEKSKSEKPKSEHPKSEHPKSEHPK